MKRAIIIIVLIFYSISFTPIPESIPYGTEILTSEIIFSSKGPGRAFGTPIDDFFGATFNTLIFDLPGHYGSFMKIFNENAGNKLILDSFSNRYKKPLYPTSGWIVGQIIGWSIKLSLLFYLFYILIKSTNRQILNN